MSGRHARNLREACAPPSHAHSLPARPPRDGAGGPARPPPRPLRLRRHRLRPARRPRPAPTPPRREPGPRRRGVPGRRGPLRPRHRRRRPLRPNGRLARLLRRRQRPGPRPRLRRRQHARTGLAHLAGPVRARRRRIPEPEGARSGPTRRPHRASARLAPDTTLYTGVYDAGNAKGYLATLSYREPQGVGVWSARLQHARAVDHDDDGGTADVDAVETVDLTFLTHADLAGFLTDLEGGTNAYMTGTSDDAEAAFTSPTIDVWRVAQVYSPAEGGAVVTYANAELRETVTVRDPIITLNVDGTGTVRDGGADGQVRTRYYGADFAVSGDGSFSGTLLRTLTSSGDTADGALVSRTDYALDGTYRQTRQRGGDGVVIRENSEG